MEFKRDPEFQKKRIEAMKNRKDNPNSGGRDFLFKKKLDLYKYRDGENIIRILPAMWAGALFPWLEVHIHYGIGPNNSQYFCPAKMANKPCPIDEEAKAMTEQGVDKKLINKLNANHRGFAWVIDRLDESKGPQMCNLPYAKVVQEIITHSFSRKTGEPVFVDDPLEGWDIIFDKQGSKLNTVYSGVRKDDEKSKLHEDEEIMNKWLEFVKANPIPDIISISSYDYIKNVLHGGESESSDTAPITSEETKRSTEITKTESKKEEKKETKIPVGDGLSKAKIKGMSREELLDVIESRKLDVTPEEWPDDGDFAEAVALELGL